MRNKKKERLTGANCREGEIEKEKGKECPQPEPRTGAGEACLLKIRPRNYSEVGTNGDFRERGGKRRWVSC